ncbi:MAG: hydratase, partial [Hyphomicrobiaceae bacterium]
GDPMNVMVWLANQQSGFGRGLKAGDIVSTGTCTGLADVAPGDVVVADFGSLGCVELMLQ